MKLRQLKRRAYRLMTTAPWDYVAARNRMWHIRHIKPCGEYSAWCSDCNAHLFPKLFGRFPHNMSEFNQFEMEQQEMDQQGMKR